MYQCVSYLVVTELENKRLKGNSLATLAPMCMIGFVSQSQRKVRNVTSPRRKVESNEVLDSGGKQGVDNAVQLKSKWLPCLITVRLVNRENMVTKTVTTDGAKSAVLDAVLCHMSCLTLRVDYTKLHYYRLRFVHVKVRGLMPNVGFKDRSV